MRSFLILAVSFALSGCAFAAATPPPGDETPQQTEFKKAYGAAADKEDRKKAFALLAGTKQMASWQLIVTAINADQDNEVKTAGYEALAKMPARDPKLGSLLAQLFKQLKQFDMDTHLAYAKVMANSEFKYELAQELAQFISTKCQYQDVITYTGNGPTQRQIDNVAKMRKQFADFVAALDALAKSDLSSQTFDHTSPQKVKKWWDANGQKLLTDDKALAEKYRAEDTKKQEDTKKP